MSPTSPPPPNDLPDLGKAEMRAILYSIGDAVISTDVEGRVVMMNPVAERLTGWSEEEARGRPLAEVFQLVNEKTRERMETPVERVLREGTSVGLANHTLLIARDGSEHPIADSGSPVTDAAGNVRGVVLVFRDQTAEREARRALAESEERYRNLVENAPVALGIHQDGRWVYLSRPTVEMLGYEDESELLGKPAVEIIHPEDRPLVAERMRRILETGRPAPPALERVLTRSGEVKYCLISSAPITYQGRPAFQATAVDITDRVELEQALKRRSIEMATLHALTLEMTESLSLQDVLESIVRRATDLLDGSGGGLYLCEPEKRRTRCVVSYKTPRDFTGTTLAYGEGAAGIVAETGEPLIIDDYRTWPHRAAVYEEEQPFRAVISAPITWRGRVQGVLHVLRGEEHEEQRFTSADLELLMLFANHAAIALENARLWEKTRRHAQELEEQVYARTEDLRKLVNAMADREIRMAELKKVIKQLRRQLLDAGMTPVADDPLAAQD
ncbi:MAG: PAS domain S-box protein [Caldilineae bacterium]|nr:MAG: PAS domain S-box protein [Caldilineae bacterium]